MDHIAIDVGGRESQVCVRSETGKILQEIRVDTRDLPKLFGRQEPSNVILETCSESFHLADAAIEHGHRVRVVPATLAKALGVGARKTKTDVRDARALSEASCRLTELPSVHVPSHESRVIKTRLSIRDALVGSRTHLVNAVRGWLRSAMVRLRSGAVETLPQRVRDAVETPPFIESALVVIETLSVQIRDVDRELATLAKSGSTTRLLMSTPGIGAQTAVAFAATLDDASLFDAAFKVAAYLGLTPGERSSGDSKHRVGITKAGSPRVLWLLIQAAWTFRRRAKTHPIALWATEVEKRRGKFVAVVALARKLAGVLFAIWRDGVPYDSKRGAAPPAARVDVTTTPVPTALLEARSGAT